MMQIAHEIAKDGVTSGATFNQKLTDTIIEYGLKRIIETGTHKGTGTTKAILAGLKQVKGERNFISIEVNPEYYMEALANNRDEPFLHILNGLSVNRSQIPVDTTFNVPHNVVVDHNPKDRKLMYHKEVMFDVEDNLLDTALAAFQYRPDMVLLDSAGHMGLIEFNYLLQRIPPDHSCLLALDDTDHVKHYDTMQFIESHPERFEVIWKVRGVTIPGYHIAGEKFGSALVRIK